MLNALRIGRYPVLASPLPPKLSTFSSSSGVGRTSSAACFCEAAEPQKGAMEEGKRPKQDEMTTDPMAESFGAAYATRCNEEGFGGIYGRNLTLPGEGEDVAVGEVRPGYDESQGSEVKEKEKGRNEKETTTTA